MTSTQTCLSRTVLVYAVDARLFSIRISKLLSFPRSQRILQCAKGGRTVGGQRSDAETYVDVLGQHLVGRAVLVEDESVSAVRGRRRAEEEAEHPRTASVSPLCP